MLYLYMNSHCSKELHIHILFVSIKYLYVTLIKSHMISSYNIRRVHYLYINCIIMILLNLLYNKVIIICLNF